MNTNWNNAVIRMTTKGPDGRYLSAITGNESDEELRELITYLVNHCHSLDERKHCPFKMLHRLPAEVRRGLVDAMRRSTMLELFETERECRIRYLV